MSNNELDWHIGANGNAIDRARAENQEYTAVLNVSGTSTHFQSGMNTIILQRAIALQCQLNDTLYDLQNICSSPLNGASFYSTDPPKATVFGHIIAVITKGMTFTHVEG